MAANGVMSPQWKMTSTPSSAAAIWLRTAGQSTNSSCVSDKSPMVPAVT
jgi:hypothetical protein